MGPKLADKSELAVSGFSSLAQTSSHSRRISNGPAEGVKIVSHPIRWRHGQILR